MIGILTVIGATLTLPGIAGIVLTMGMAVDANVLIYERMREEARLGRSTISAIESGFTAGALATIIDSHLTALIAAIALFALGSGPIRGFAVAFAIGIISTLFTAYLLTRLIVAIWVRQTRPEDRAALGSHHAPPPHPRRHQDPVHEAGEDPHADLARPDGAVDRAASSRSD